MKPWNREGVSHAVLDLAMEPCHSWCVLRDMSIILGVSESQLTCVGQQLLTIH